MTGVIPKWNLQKVNSITDISRDFTSVAISHTFLGDE